MFAVILATVGVVGTLLLVAPTLMVFIASFTSGYALRFPPPGLSLQWYQTLLFESDDIHQAALWSLQVAGVSTAVSALLSTLAAVGLVHRRQAWARAFETVFTLPLMLPSLALGLALLLGLSLAGVRLSMATLIVGHIVICTPFILKTTLASLVQIDLAMLEASMSLGASSARSLRRVVLPLAARGILAGSFIAFMYSFDNVTISVFLSAPPVELLPIRLWNLIEHSLDPRVAAAASCLIFGTLILSLVMERVTGVGRYLR